jgi:hypothetical protein
LRRLRRAGSRSTSISIILLPLTVKPMTENGCPPGRHETIPAVPFTSTGCTDSARRENMRACWATVRAPWISFSPPGMWSDLSTTSGSSTAKSPSKSPTRAAARKASTAFLCCVRSTSGIGPDPLTFRRARLASCLAATGEHPTMEAISSNGTANMSCSTNPSRSWGAKVSNDKKGQPNRVGYQCFLFGIRSSRPRIKSVKCSSRNSSPRDLRDRSMSRHTRPMTVVSHPPHPASRASGTPLPANEADFLRTFALANLDRPSVTLPSCVSSQ